MAKYFTFLHTSIPGRVQKDWVNNNVYMMHPSGKTPGRTHLVASIKNRSPDFSRSSEAIYSYHLVWFFTGQIKTDDAGQVPLATLIDFSHNFRAFSEAL